MLSLPFLRVVHGQSTAGEVTAARRWPGCRGVALAVLCGLVTATPSGAQTFTWTGGGSDSNWSTSANWSSAPSSGGNTTLMFAGSTRPTANNSFGSWSFDVGRLAFAGDAASFTLTGNAFGFRAYQGNQEQQIIQNSGNLQTVSVDAFSFRPDVNTRINLNAGDLTIASSFYIDMTGTTWRQFYVSGSDSTRRTLTIAGTLNRGGSGLDPDVVVEANKRLLVTGTVANGQGTDGSLFIDNGLAEFAATGGMTGGSAVVGATTGTASAALMLNAAGSTFAQQVEIRGGSSGVRTVGSLASSGTVTFSGDFYSTLSPTDYNLAAASGGTLNVSGGRNLIEPLTVNRTDATSTYGGTVILSGTTTSTGDTSLYAGTLQVDSFSRLGSGTSSLVFASSAGTSGTFRYTGATGTTTKPLAISTSGLTRAAIDVSQAGTNLSWSPSAGTLNKNLTKVGSGTLTFGGTISGGSIGVEAGTLALTGSNTPGGGGSVTLAGGTLSVRNVNALGASAPLTFTGGVLQYSSQNAEDYSSRMSSSPAAQVRIDTNGRDVTYESGLASVGGTLEKMGDGTLTLNGNNSAGGLTTVTGGEL